MQTYTYSTHDSARRCIHACMHAAKAACVWCSLLSWLCNARGTPPQAALHVPQASFHKLCRGPSSRSSKKHDPRSNMCGKHEPICICEIHVSGWAYLKSVSQVEHM